MIQLANNLYKSKEDFIEFQDQMGKILDSKDAVCGGDCKKCKSTNNNIRVKNITFIVTEDCNLNCTYCYEKHKTKRKMSKEVAKKAVDFIFDKNLINGYYDIDNDEAVVIEFIGGEPLLEIDLMDYIVDYFKVKAFSLSHPWATNYMINITSNGILFNSPKVKQFFDKNDGHVSIGITIDGDKELHDACRVFPDGSGSYDIVEKAVVNWSKIDVSAQTKITLCPDNVMHLNKALQNVWSLGINGAATNCVFEKGWTVDDAKILYEEMIKLSDYLIEDNKFEKYYCSLFEETIGTTEDDDQNWCGGNGQMLAIGVDGKCFPCIRFAKYSLVNREEQPIGDIWKGLDTRENNNWLDKLCSVTRTSQLCHEDNKKCLTCPISSGCSLCTAYNYDEFGDPNHKATYICDTHKARVLANVYHWNNLYKHLNLDKKFKCNVPKDWALEIISEGEYDRLLKLQE